MDKTKQIKLRGQVSSIIVFVLIISVHLPWIDFNGVAAGDTHGYVEVSKLWDESIESQFRPPGYPALIGVSRYFSPNNPFVFLVSLQVLLYSFSAVVFYKLFQKLNIFSKNWISVLCVIFMFGNPQSLFSNNLLLPEMIPLFMVSVLLLLIAGRYSNARLFGMVAIALAAYFLKPIWITLIILPVILVFYENETIKKKLILMVTVIGLVGVSFFLKNSLSFKPESSEQRRSNFDVCMNSIAIRLGLTKGADNTSLYKELASKGLIEKVHNRKWSDTKEEFVEFREIYTDLDWGFLSERAYWLNVMLFDRQGLAKYISKQLSRVPKFYSTSAENMHVKFYNTTLTKLYQRVYSGIHKFHLVGLGNLIFIGIVFVKIKSKPLLSYLYIIASISFVIVFFTYQDPHFLRMRASIEPLLLFPFFYLLHFSMIYSYGLIKSKITEI